MIAAGGNDTIIGIGTMTIADRLGGGGATLGTAIATTGTAGTKTAATTMTGAGR